MKILGLIDIFATFLLLAIAYNIDVPSKIIIPVAVCLFLKALICLMDIGSMFDIGTGVLLILSLSMTFHPAILFIAAILIGSKGIMSLFA